MTYIGINDNPALTKPYDLHGTVNAEMIRQIDEMLDDLYRMTIKIAEETGVNILEVEEQPEEEPVVNTDILQASVTLTLAQIQSAGTVPVVVVPGVADKIIQVLGWSSHGIINGTPGYSVAGFWGLYYAIDTAFSILLTNNAAMWLTTAMNRYQVGSLAIGTWNIGTLNVIGDGVVIRSTTNRTGGNATDTLKVYVTYSLLDP